MATSEVIILAGGKGVRMNSALPKSMQLIGGQPMVRIIVNNVVQAGVDHIHVVHGDNGRELQNLFPKLDINFVKQSKALGTGHAALQTLPFLRLNSTICILYGDNPLIRPQTIQTLISQARNGALVLLTATVDDPTGYGRIVRNSKGVIKKIVEEKDATVEQLNINEINAGPLAAKAEQLKYWLHQLENNNQQNEYYLTDIVDFAVADEIEISAYNTRHPSETIGVNNRIEQAKLERCLQLENAERLMLAGVQISDPNRFDLRGECNAGNDCHIDVNSILEGQVQLADNVSIGANSIIRNSTVAENVEILPNTIIDGAIVEAGCRIGPYARIRPGTILKQNCKIGNFVEIKASIIGESTKVNHHAYVGDAEIGSYVNFGAGSIICNYDGKHKHHTKIGNDVFIGSNSSLVAPLKIGDNATIGAGSTITKDVGANQLAVERSKLKTMATRQAVIKKHE